MNLSYRIVSYRTFKVVGEGGGVVRLGLMPSPKVFQDLKKKLLGYKVSYFFFH